MSLSYSESLQRIADEFFSVTGRGTATTKEIAIWAIQTERWDPPADLVVRKCREDFSRALREQYINDEFGRPVRAKHVARISRGDRKQYLWADIRNANSEHMAIAFQQRREQIVGDCRQLDRDVNFYNSTRSDQPAIQMVFDFSDDIEEGRFSGKMPDENGSEELD